MRRHREATTSPTLGRARRPSMYTGSRRGVATPMALEEAPPVTAHIVTREPSRRRLAEMQLSAGRGAAAAVAAVTAVRQATGVLASAAKR